MVNVVERALNPRNIVAFLAILLVVTLVVRFIKTNAAGQPFLQFLPNL